MTITTSISFSPIRNTSFIIVLDLPTQVKIISLYPLPFSSPCRTFFVSPTLTTVLVSDRAPGRPLHPYLTSLSKF